MGHVFLGQDGSMYRGWKLKVRRLPHLLRTIDNEQHLLRFIQLNAFFLIGMSSKLMIIFLPLKSWSQMVVVVGFGY